MGSAALGEDAEHAPLIVGPQVEEAAPGKDPIEPFADRRASHVADRPTVPGHPLAAQRDQARGSVDARHDQAAGGHVQGDGRTRSASEIEDGRARRQGGDEAIVPRPIVPAARAPIRVPGDGVPLVMRDDAVSEIHRQYPSVEHPPYGSTTPVTSPPISTSTTESTIPAPAALAGRSRPYRWMRVGVLVRPLRGDGCSRRPFNHTEPRTGNDLPGAAEVAGVPWVAFPCDDGRMDGADASRQPRTDLENLAGLFERVTFHNPDNDFCVLRLKARGHRDLVTVVGHAALISAGEFVQAAGTSANDRTHGQQFKASFLSQGDPADDAGGHL